MVNHEVQQICGWGLLGALYTRAKPSLPRALENLTSVLYLIGRPRSAAQRYNLAVCADEALESRMWSKCEAKNCWRPRSETNSLLHAPICAKRLLALLLLDWVFPHAFAYVWSICYLSPGKACHQCSPRSSSIRGGTGTPAHWSSYFCVWCSNHTLKIKPSLAWIFPSTHVLHRILGAEVSGWWSSDTLWVTFTKLWQQSTSWLT